MSHVHVSRISVYSKPLEAFFMFYKHKNAMFNGEQEKKSIICVRVGEKNSPLATTVCHHSASLVMPNGDPRD